MMIGTVLLAVVAFLGFISYRRPKLEQRVFKNIPYTDWINILIVPLGMYAGLFLIVRNIVLRSNIQVLDLDNLTLGAIGALFLVYAFVGNSIHFVGKVLSRYIPQKKHTLSYQVNEMFHGNLSHYLSYVCSCMVLFMIALLEMNYPLSEPLSDISIRILLLAGISFGISGARIIFYTSAWFGGYNKPIFFLVSVLLLTLWALIRSNGLNLWYYPVNMFVISFFSSISGTFLARRVMILMGLSSRRRLRFLTNLFSVT